MDLAVSATAHAFRLLFSHEAKFPHPSVGDRRLSAPRAKGSRGRPSFRFANESLREKLDVTVRSATITDCPFRPVQMETEISCGGTRELSLQPILDNLRGLIILFP
jgi:hypothetical protein